MANRAVIYARVSTDAQDTSNQLPQLERWALERGFELRHTYAESSTAWKQGHQRELSALIDAARRRRFDVVIVWALDRLSRQGCLAVLQLIQTLANYNVRVISYTESWTELPGAAHELLLAITAWVAQFESKRRSERTKAALERLKASGRTLGRPRGAKDKHKRVRRRL